MTKTRREFIGESAAVMGAALGTVCLGGCATLAGKSAMPMPPASSYRIEETELFIDLAKTPDLQGIGGAVKYAFPALGEEHKVIVARTGENVFVALPDRCSHGSRELNYLHDEDIFRCSSFGRSRFATDGTVQKGPAKSDLSAFPVARKGQALVVRFA